VKGRTVLALLAVLAALLAYVLVVERGKPDPDAVEAERMVLTRVDVDRTVAVELRAGGRITKLSRDTEGRWFLRAPVEDRADDHQVRALLAELSPLVAIEQVEGSKAEQITYRLDRPTVECVVSRPSGSGFDPVTLTVGRKNPAFDAYYAMVNGDRSRIGLIDPHVVENYLLRDPDGYRYRRVAEFRLDDVARFGIAHDGRRILLQRNDDREWVIVSPIRSYADQGAVNTVIHRFVGQRKDAFIDDPDPDLAAYGLDAPTLELRVELENGAQRALLVGAVSSDGEAAYAMRPGSETRRVFTIPLTSRDELDPTLFELRYRRFLLLRDAGVVGITVTTPDRRLEARVSGGEWSDPDGRPLPRGTLDALREGLVGLTAEAFRDGVDPATVGLDPPPITVEVRLADDTIQRVGLGPDEGETLARVLPDGPVARVPRSEYDRLVRLVASASPSTGDR